MMTMKHYIQISFLLLAAIMLVACDKLSMDEKVRLADANAERINIPANPRHYWRYRMHLTIEQLMNENELNEEIISLIENSGRS